MSAARRDRRRPSAAAPPTPPRSRTPLLLALLIVVAGVCTYANSLGGPFIWDDQIAIVTNPTIQHLWPLLDPLTPPRETPVAGRPLVNLSFAINYAFGGLDDTGYHVGNIALHLACALLLFGIVRRTLLAMRRGSDLTACLVALLWMVHPLQSEPVNYLTQRSESLMALFFLLTLYAAIRARHSAGRGASRWQIVAILACACGMASKESMVVAPLVVVLYDWAFEFDSFGSAARARGRFYGGLAATWLMAAALMLTAPRSTVGLTTTSGSWTYLLNQVEIIGRYLRLSVWPDVLVLDYGLPRPLSAGDVLPGAIVIVALIAVTGYALRRWPRAGFLAASFFLLLAPTSSVVVISSEVGAERRMYLPFAALATLAVVGGWHMLDRLGSIRTANAASAASTPGRPAHDAPAVPRSFLFAAAGLAAAIIIALAVRTVARNAEYASPLHLWQTVVDRRPHGRARMALAIELVAADRHAEAVAQLRQAVQDFPDARAALGTELIVASEPDEGMAVLRQFVRDGPTLPNRIPAHVMLAQALTAAKQFDAAAEEWRAVLALAPTDAGATASLAQLVSAQAQDALRQGNPTVGERYAREAVQLAPRDGQAHNLLGVALASKGNMTEALVHFREAVQMTPGDAQFRANLERATGALGGKR